MQPSQQDNNNRFEFSNRSQSPDNRSEASNSSSKSYYPTTPPLGSLFYVNKQHASMHPPILLSISDNSSNQRNSLPPLHYYTPSLY